MALKYESQFGLVRRGVIAHSNQGAMTVRIQSDQNSYNASLAQQTRVPMPYVLAYNNGLMIAAKPVKGTPVAVEQGEGNEGYFHSFLPQGPTLNLFPAINDDEIVISGSVNNYIKVNTSNDIIIGNKTDYIKFSTPDKKAQTLISCNIDNEFYLTQSKMKVSGLVLREQSQNPNYIDSSKLTNDDYNSEMKIVSMDPSSPFSFSNNSRKNPPFVEERELVFEFASDAKIEQDSVESDNYDPSKAPAQPLAFLDRRNSRANTLNLNVYNPNALIEETKGTLVDIFGNVLDINRNAIAIDKISATAGKKAFLSIKADERQSVAYHFEINARKDPNSISAYDSSDNFGRARSNFSLDVDKEGLFKLNVPATSESGSVPLPVRHLNASALTQNPNQLSIVDNDTNIDLQADGFGQGVISVKKNNSDVTQVDRITSNHIQYGSVYHDVTKTSFVFTSNDYVAYLNGGYGQVSLGSVSSQVSTTAIGPITDTISSSIVVGSNAGGRSGFLNFDGSVDVNIGANTIDKQSLLLDTQGSVVANVGRDKRNISVDVSLDGALIAQVGAPGVSGDPRFSNEAMLAGVVDIRVLNATGQVSIVRIDATGVQIISQARMHLHSEQDMNITSNSKIQMDAPEVVIQKRLVKRIFGGSI